jgi:hypothetical protein
MQQLRLLLVPLMMKLSSIGLMIYCGTVKIYEKCPDYCSVKKFLLLILIPYFPVYIYIFRALSLKLFIISALAYKCNCIHFISFHEQASAMRRHEIKKLHLHQFEMQTHKHVRALRRRNIVQQFRSFIKNSQRNKRNNMLLMNENEKCLCNKKSCYDADTVPDFNVQFFKHMHEFISLSLHHR